MGRYVKDDQRKLSSAPGVGLGWAYFVRGCLSIQLLLEKKVSVTVIGLMAPGGGGVQTQANKTDLDHCTIVSINKLDK